jgi:hypothetical protein
LQDGGLQCLLLAALVLNLFTLWEGLVAQLGVMEMSAGLEEELRPDLLALAVSAVVVVEHGGLLIRFVGGFVG